MKKVLFLTFALVLLFQTTAFAEPKVGVVSIQSILVNCDYGKAVAAKMKTKFDPMKQDLEKQAKEIQQLESELKNQDLALKLDAKQDKQREYRRLVRDFQDSRAAFQEKFQIESQKLQQPLLQKIVKVTNEYGKAKNYSMIIEMTNVVIYVADGVDVTNEIVTELNKLKKAGK